MRLVKEHNIATRNDLVDAAHRLADFIQTYLDKGEPVPVINIIGSVSGGKSIFWDFVIPKLLGEAPIFLAKYSESTQELGRLYETWTQLDTQQPLKLFLCNVRASDAEAAKLDMKSLEDGEVRNFGDVIILTNAPQGFIPKHIKQLEISLTVMSKDPKSIFPSTLSYTCNL